MRTKLGASPVRPHGPMPPLKTDTTEITHSTDSLTSPIFIARQIVRRFSMRSIGPTTTTQPRRANDVNRAGGTGAAGWQWRKRLVRYAQKVASNGVSGERWQRLTSFPENLKDARNRFGRRAFSRLYLIVNDTQTRGAKIWVPGQAVSRRRHLLATTNTNTGAQNEHE
jgi:hypothetical protein